MELRRLNTGDLVPVHITPDVVVPNHLEVEVTRAAIPHVERLHLTITSAEGGSPTCRRIDLFASADDALGVTTESLRDIPVGALVAAIASEYAYVYVDNPDWIAEPARSLVPVASAPPAAQELVRDAVGGSASRRWRITNDLLREVADVYREAMLVSGSKRPTLAVQERWHISPATAARWVRKARERGYLGAAVKGKAGEETPKRKGKS